MKKTLIGLVVLLITLTVQAQIRSAQYSYAAYAGKGFLWGFQDERGDWVVHPTYQFTYWYRDAKVGSFRAQQNGASGLVNEWGKVIFPIGKYKDYFAFEKGEKWYIELTGMDGKKGLSTIDGKIIIQCIYQDINTASMDDEKIIKVQETNGLWGVFDISGKQMIPARYAEYGFYYYKENGIIEVTNREGLKGVVSGTGKELLPCKYKELELYYFKEHNVIEVQNISGQWGLASANGTEIIPCKYYSLNMYYYPKYVKVKNKEGRVGILKKDNGDFIELIPVAKSDFTDCNIYESYITTQIIKDDAKKGLFAIDGKMIAPCVYEDAQYAAEGIALVNRGGHEEHSKVVGGKWGYCANGKEIIPCEYDQATVFKNNVATVKKDGEVKLIKNPLKDGSQIQIAVNNPSSKKKGGPAISRYPAPNSDVDKNIPLAKKTADNTFAFIIANENYPDAPVPYSLNDGRMFKEYCQKALGLPEKNINLYEDATFGNIITAVEKIKQIADAYDGEASVIFYYAGHGFPDEKQSTAYLLPIDGNASDITTTGYSLAKLYKELSQLKLKSSIVFLDACFSGAKREDQMLASARGVAIKVKEEEPQGNMVVFSAAQGDETAHQMEEKGHGLFTYFLLKELQETGGDVDMGTLTDYVTRQVKRQSVVINNKKQTPTVIPSQALVNNWQKIKLK